MRLVHALWLWWCLGRERARLEKMLEALKR
jgi:hypothetical protein